MSTIITQDYLKGGAAFTSIAIVILFAVEHRAQLHPLLQKTFFVATETQEFSVTSVEPAPAVILDELVLEAAPLPPTNRSDTDSADDTVLTLTSDTSAESQSAYSKAKLPLIPGENCHPKFGYLPATSDAVFTVVVWIFLEAPDASQEIIHAQKTKFSAGSGGASKASGR